MNGKKTLETMYKSYIQTEQYKNLEKWEKDDFDKSVKKIHSKL